MDMPENIELLYEEYRETLQYDWERIRAHVLKTPKSVSEEQWDTIYKLALSFVCSNKPNQAPYLDFETYQSIAGPKADSTFRRDMGLVSRLLIQVAWGSRIEAIAADGDANHESDRIQSLVVTNRDDKVAKLVYDSRELVDDDEANAKGEPVWIGYKPKTSGKVIEFYVGRMKARTQPTTEERSVAVVSACLQAYDDRMSAPDATWFEQVKTFRRLARTAASQHGECSVDHEGEKVRTVYHDLDGSDGCFRSAIAYGESLMRVVQDDGNFTGIGVRIGIDYGLALVVKHADRANEYLGAPIDVADALQLHAAPDEVMINESMRKQVPDREGKQGPRIDLPGDRFISGFTLDAPHNANREYRLKFVGRIEEQSIVKDCFATFDEEKSRISWITGRQGVGRTRFWCWIKTMIDAERALPESKFADCGYVFTNCRTLRDASQEEATAPFSLVVHLLAGLLHSSRYKQEIDIHLERITNLVEFGGGEFLRRALKGDHPRPSSYPFGQFVHVFAALLYDQFQCNDKLVLLLDNLQLADLWSQQVIYALINNQVLRRNGKILSFIVLDEELPAEAQQHPDSHLIKIASPPVVDRIQIATNYATHFRLEVPQQEIERIATEHELPRTIIDKIAERSPDAFSVFNNDAEMLLEIVRTIDFDVSAEFLHPLYGHENGKLTRRKLVQLLDDLADRNFLYRSETESCENTYQLRQSQNLQTRLDAVEWRATSEFHKAVVDRVLTTEFQQIAALKPLAVAKHAHLAAAAEHRYWKIYVDLQLRAANNAFSQGKSAEAAIVLKQALSGMPDTAPTESLSLLTHLAQATKNVQGSKDPEYLEQIRDIEQRLKASKSIDDGIQFQGYRSLWSCYYNTRDEGSLERVQDCIEHMEKLANLTLDQRFELFHIKSLTQFILGRFPMAFEAQQELIKLCDDENLFGPEPTQTGNNIQLYTDHDPIPCVLVHHALTCWFMGQFSIARQYEQVCRNALFPHRYPQIDPDVSFQMRNICASSSRAVVVCHLAALSLQRAGDSLSNEERDDLSLIRNELKTLSQNSIERRWLALMSILAGIVGMRLLDANTASQQQVSAFMDEVRLGFDQWEQLADPLVSMWYGLWSRELRRVGRTQVADGMLDKALAIADTNNAFGERSFLAELLRMKADAIHTTEPDEARQKLRRAVQVALSTDCEALMPALRSQVYLVMSASPNEDDWSLLQNIVERLQHQGAKHSDSPELEQALRLLSEVGAKPGEQS